MNNLENTQTLKSVCAIIKCEEKVYLENVTITNGDNIWSFPSIAVKQSEIAISALVNYIANVFSLDAKNIEINYFCNIKHKGESVFLDIDAFIVEVNLENIKNNVISKNKWFKIDDLFNIPLTPEAVTLAQVLMEC